ncbi:unnamed protein product [Parnassius apollo]|uniref:(apollo) hypothetical protein n=1 Tax=Parnassius apollo TaxID=110799 RepID=A0A8S3XMT6_PARAO|nr:unnamed protein product [Parnassius apollo]
MKCAGCLKVTKNASVITCTSPKCEKTYCSYCINLTSVTVEGKKCWKCPECSVSKKKGGDNTQTPIRSNPDSQNVTMRKKDVSDCQTPETEIRELTAVIARLTSEFSTLKTKLDEVTHSLCHCHERMDELVRGMSANENRLTKLEKRDQEIINLHASVAHLQNELNIQAQQGLRNEIEIVGIPEGNNENLEHIVKVAAQKVGAQLEDVDVDWITRVGPRRLAVPPNVPDGGSRMPRPIVVRLLRRSKRDQVLKAFKSRKTLTSADLGIIGSPIKVFCNERLTKENSLLFREARARAKTHDYAFCWCNQGAIYIRKREGKAATLIRTKHDLDRHLPTKEDI